MSQHLVPKWKCITQCGSVRNSSNWVTAQIEVALQFHEKYEGRQVTGLIGQIMVKHYAWCVQGWV